MLSDAKRLASAVFYSWVGPLVALGRSKALGFDDMPPPPPQVDPHLMLAAFTDLPLTRPWAFLVRVLWIMRRQMLGLLGLLGLCAVFNISAPLLVHHLLVLLAPQAPNLALAPALLTAVALCLASVGEALSFQHFIYWAVSSASVVSSGMNALLYRQTLALSRSSRQKFATGDVVNLMGSDADSIGEFSKTVVEITYSLVLVTAVVICLYRLLGVTALAAVAVLALLSPGTALLARAFIRLDALSMLRRDDRVSRIAQALAGIRIVKYFAWQERILGEIRRVRATEVGVRRRLAVLRSCAVVFDLGPSTLVSVATFGTYVALGHRLDAATVFACLGLLAQLEYPFGNLTVFISTIAEAKVGAERIGKYLAEAVVVGDDRPVSPPFAAIGFELRALSARYGDGSHDVLRAIDLVVQPGEAIAVVGPVGSGKSSLLLALLAEIPLQGGTLAFTALPPGHAPRTAFVPQEAFMQNGTLRDNILFGRTAQDLNTVVASCALAFDVSRLPGGLETEIGEHGVNLSGGQKQRVGLARAVVAQPGLALFDDPLAAVDIRTEDQLVEACLFGALRPATRVVVTHRLKHLARFDRVVFLEQGAVTACGPYAELLANSPRFAAFVADTLREEQVLAQVETSAAPDLATEVMRITDDEDRETGAVKTQVYADYLHLMAGSSRIGRGLIMAALFCTVLAVTVLPMIQTAWLSVWTDHLSTEHSASLRTAPFSQWLTPLLGSEHANILLYGGIGLLLLTAYFAQNLLWSLRAVAAGRTLHDEALKATLAAPLRFFDATPIGRILNRFSRDVDAIERQLPWAFEAIVRSVFATTASIVVVLTVLPPVALVIVPVLVLFYRIQGRYRASSREAQRLTSIASSPRFAHFKETLQGLTVIRAFHQKDAFTEQYYQALSGYHRMFYAMIVMNRWFSIRVPLISAMVSLAVAVGVVFSTRLGFIAAGTTGMALAYALRFWGHLNWSVRAFSEVESRMTSVERLRFYAGIKPEPETTALPVLAAAEAWPVAGEVVFHRVSVRYAPHLPDVLREVSFQVPAGARVGLIGRTGSGKSTVFQVLFRFLTAHAGTVTIDGVDVACIPLPRLRRSLAVIPQDPTLFKGVLRENLDRFHQHSDAAIWQALGRAHLQAFVAGLPGGLKAEVKEHGHNFSQGQRQLFCLARALLVDAKIIVMDEATASVDSETDALIQATIRRECAGRTLLIIAHRLWTVHDCDLVLELEDGALKRSFKPQGAASLLEV